MAGWNSTTLRHPRAGGVRLPVRWILVALLVAALGAGIAVLPAAADLELASSLPLLLAIVPLLAALAFAARSWVAHLRAPAGGGSTPSLDWTELASLASRFFEAHGMTGPSLDAQWHPTRDLLLRRDRQAYLVRARLWRASQVDAAAVQLLVRDAVRQGAARGILLCARNVYTPAARQLARQHGVLLLDPVQLQVRPASKVDAAAVRAPVPEPVQASPAATASPAPVAKPLLRPEHEVRRRRRQFAPTDLLADAADEAEAATVMIPLEERPTPVLSDHPLRARPQFEPTVPASGAADAADVPTVAGTLEFPGASLLADRKVPSRREFLPTVPMSADIAAL